VSARTGNRRNGRLTRHNSDYIQIRQPVYISHSAGRYAVKRFRKAQCPIIERLTNSLMMNGRNNGKKLMAVRIVAHAFEIVRIPRVLAHRTQ
jgi:small subunit ribosomal protein S5e